LRDKALAARFSDDISARFSNSARDRRDPIGSLELLCRSVSRSASVTSSISVPGRPASRTTMAVITLVIDAIGSTASAFF
jgi:hypothetical protein